VPSFSVYVLLGKAGSLTESLTSHCPKIYGNMFLKWEGSTDHDFSMSPHRWDILFGRDGVAAASLDWHDAPQREGVIPRIGNCRVSGGKPAPSILVCLSLQKKVRAE
jgi:hypothetical protein